MQALSIMGPHNFQVLIFSLSPSHAELSTNRPQRMLHCVLPKAVRSLDAQQHTRSLHS